MSAFNKMLFRIFVKLILFYHYQLENYNSFANNCQQQAFPSCNITGISIVQYRAYTLLPFLRHMKKVQLSTLKREQTAGSYFTRKVYLLNHFSS